MIVRCLLILNFIKALLNKSAACALLGRYEDALASIDLVLQLEPRHAEAFYNRGLIHKRLGDFELVADDYRSALSLMPGNRDVQMSLALLELLHGNYKQGWRLYTARRSVRQQFPYLPKVLPGDLTGRRMLVLKDQGLGDEYFFCVLYRNCMTEALGLHTSPSRRLNRLSAASAIWIAFW